MCSRPEPTIDDNQIELKQTVINYKDSIIYIDSIIYTHVSVKDSISKSNKNTLDIYYDERIDSLNSNKETIIDKLVYEIEIDDTIISNLNKTIEYRDTVIHNLEILEKNFKSMLNETERELFKSEKKIKRKNIWIIISSTVAIILSFILIAS